MTGIEDRLPALYHALKEQQVCCDVSLEQLRPFPTTGLAHDHVEIMGSDVLLRVPRQSQMRLDAERNLAYQAACFERMSASGHTPAYYGTLPPGEALPMGALLIQHIRGTVLDAPRQLPHAARALASIHALPLPPQDLRAPLMDQQDPMQETLREVQGQAAFLEAAKLERDSFTMICEELEAAKQDVTRLPTAPQTLISFDAHPGNFMIDGTGKAYLVDLEKGRYGGAGFDLAHATLYTSTTWDVATCSEPTAQEIQSFYESWQNAMPATPGEALQPYLMPMRRLMWLWSITWCAKWRVESKKDHLAQKHIQTNTEDWSAKNTDAALVDHVAERVECYLSPRIIEQVRQDWR